MTTSLSNRRGFLRALGGAAALSSFGTAFGQSRVTTKGQTPTALLGLAATAEALMVTLYHEVLSHAEFEINPDSRAQLALMLQAEQSHLQLLGDLGGKPLTTRFNLPGDLNGDARRFAETALHLEEVSTGAYLAATHEFAASGQPELAAAAAQLGASEAQHLALLSQLAGMGTREVGLPAVQTAPDLSAFIGQPAQGWISLPLPSARQVEAFGKVARSVPAFRVS